MKNHLEDIIQEYRKYAFAHGVATIAGDCQSANKNYVKMSGLAPAIMDYGKEGEIALAQHTQDVADSVACWSATDLLKVDEQKAIAVLKRLAAKTGPIALDAEMVLKQWEKGELLLP